MDFASLKSALVVVQNIVHLRYPGVPPPRGPPRTTPAGPRTAARARCSPAGWRFQLRGVELRALREKKCRSMEWKSYLREFALAIAVLLRSGVARCAAQSGVRRGDKNCGESGCTALDSPNIESRRIQRAVERSNPRPTPPQHIARGTIFKLAASLFLQI